MHLKLERGGGEKKFENGLSQGRKAISTPSKTKKGKQACKSWKEKNGDTSAG